MLDVSVGFLIILGITSNIFFKDKIYSLTQDLEKCKLKINDYEVESAILSAIVEIMDIFGKDVSMEEILSHVNQSISNFFKKEVVIVQLFGEHFFQDIKGGSINLPEETFEEIATQAYPILINNLNSFQRYKFLETTGISSFILVPLKNKKEETVGVIGVFSKNQRVFTQKDLSLLKLISVPISLIIENAELIEKTKVLSITDPLTHLYNRRHFQFYIEKITEQARKEKFHVSLAMCDIDNFKIYNDRNGHPAGDKLLRDIAEILHQNIKGSDIIARYGGEEFVIIFPNTHKDTAFHISDAIRNKIKDVEFPGEEFQPGGDLTISFGIACFPCDADTYEDLIRKADIALYEAKRQGRNRTIVFNGLK
ncbi:MAG TPA: sensor domain-containing diguanylate cyclase [Candidatus Ratteibacteria bacterium]|jgi:diguanylate cyclase (GGDEF)-like protein|nr:sensor domain-containing diguanylate cyclase [bacterium]HOQ81654.1 sensor domain-containing diguanylate cyclase [bacterium]HPC28799.1 sensor domain-containing diguanylate cyclase [bacterium]HRS05439.1 sensor domain-containing diguanylate cyclase [Candidatus Ratteibacteria bacterium]HRV04269.1 sensor domain-containing diguanylate cyclase [Candidatus Ratteibacteria bacterium]